MSDDRAPQVDAGGATNQAPQDVAVRTQIRAVASELACDLARDTPPSREHLAERGRAALKRLGLPEEFLGWAMVAINNAFWREQYEAVPVQRRLLLLPKCLRDPAVCRASFDSVGLHCAQCGACLIAELSRDAEQTGYSVIIAEGTSSVIMKVLEGEADAILGVACLHSLDESFDAISELGVPNQAIPLPYDGCVSTECEPDVIRGLLLAERVSSAVRTRTAIPLLRVTRGVFESDSLDDLLQPFLTDGALTDDAVTEPLLETEALGVEWLRRGGKRLRPFVTVAAWALGRHGLDALAAGADAQAMLIAPVRSLAVAIEALHKASLIHDDIADGDEFRYGRPTLHVSHGVGRAVNVGDWLVGLGYRLIAAQAEALGAERVTPILARLASAQLALSRGQGAELAWIGREGGLRPVDALQIGALKTAPAFEVALFAGLCAAGAEFDDPLIRRFSTYLGEAYQVLNDLEDWRPDASNKVALGRDVLTGRPTILRAFATEAGRWDGLAEAAEADDAQAAVMAVRALYEACGAFERARALVDGLRGRCLSLAAETRPEALGELLRFLTRTVLRERRP